jgi:hypothetical protein
MVATALELWETTEMLGPFQALLRSAVTSEQAAAMLREFLTEVILAPVATATRGDPGSAPFRAGLVATQMLGLAMARYVLQIGPVARASRAELAAAVGPTIERYLTGDVG